MVLAYEPFLEGHTNEGVQQKMVCRNLGRPSHPGG